jgi:hypothetical protein
MLSRQVLRSLLGEHPELVFDFEVQVVLATAARDHLLRLRPENAIASIHEAIALFRILANSLSAVRYRMRQA